MELRDYLRIMHKNWLLITLATLLGLALGAGVTLAATPQYKSTTQLYVSARTDDAGLGDMVTGTNFVRQILGSYVEVVGTALVLDPVIETLQLDMTAADLAKHVSANSPKDSVLLNVTVTGPDSNQNALIANAVGQSLKEVVNSELEPEGPTGVSPVKLTTTQTALPSASPVSPNPSRNLALGLLLGAALGFGLAVLRSVLDTRIHSLHDIEQVTDAPVIGGIIDDPDAAKDPLVVHSDRLSPRAESFRTLRTNLQFLNVGEDARIFVISSAGPGEGKSTTCANLAISLAEAGNKVALIEGDLRLPKVSEYLGLETAAGLTDVLIGNAELSDVLHRWGRGQMYVLPSGRIPPNPSELLGSKAMKGVLDALGESFDYVLIDAPPTLMVTDAVVLGKQSSGVLLVAASGRTTKQAFAAAVRTLGTAGTPFSGVIVTMMPAKGPDSYGYGYYKYGYGYGEEAALKAAEQAAADLTAFAGPSAQQTPAAQSGEAPTEEPELFGRRWPAVEPGQSGEGA